jgi:hypothetical protein
VDRGAMGKRPRQHAWELPPSAGAESQSQHAWEQAAASSSGSIGEQARKRNLELAGHEEETREEEQEPQAPSEGGGFDTSQEEAGQELASMLLQLHVEGRLTAKHLCQLSYYASRAGATGPVATYALRPDASSGHFQRHVDKAANLRDPDQFYHLEVPGFRRVRTTMQVEVLLPHEQLHKEVCDSPGLRERLRNATWPASFAQHPVVRAARGQPVLPLALYLDGAQYSKAGASVLVFVVVNLLSGLRHLVCVLDKRRVCKCGCRGWCTFHPIMAFLRWSFAVLASGLHPPADHEGKPWPADGQRLSLAQLPLACGRGAVQQIRGDWAEFSHTLGFPTWHSSDHPCLWCRADRDTLYDARAEWELTGHASYELACDRCEVHVQITSHAALLQVAQLLFYDKRTYGKRGRCLKAAVPALGLLKGDRLEPTPRLQDVAKFETQAVPCTVTFWRKTEETSTKHRNPLFDRAIGIGVQTLKVDSLHCLALGVWQVVLSAVLAAIVAHDIYGAEAAGATTIESKRQHTFQALAKELAQWMAKRRNEFTLVQSELALPLRLKGGEAKTLLHFMAAKLEDGLSRALGEGKAMLRALKALVQNYDCISAADSHLWTQAAQEEHGNTKTQPHNRHLRLGNQRGGWTNSPLS